MCSNPEHVEDSAWPSWGSKLVVHQLVFDGKQQCLVVSWRVLCLRSNILD